MHILIAGGSGFLGSRLASSFAANTHKISILTRQPDQTRSSPSIRFLPWTPERPLGIWTDTIGPVDVIINLAGASIADARWSADRKTVLATSRQHATRALATFIKHADPKPHLFVSASAIGYYGNQGDRELAEDAAPGTDFLARLAVDWEAAALPAASPQTRLVLLRTGIVLDPAGGALPRMLLPFRLGAGGPFGSGRQFMSWIHRDDWLGLVRWIIDTPTVSGPVNLTAPSPVTNREFARTLGRTIHRPAIVPAPAFALRLALGEMADPLLLYSQRVLPARALAGGYSFAFASLDRALQHLLVPTS